MKLGILNKQDTFILRWDYNRNTLLQSPIVAGLGDSWLGGVGTTGDQTAFRKVQLWLEANTTNSKYLNNAVGGYATNQFMPSELLYRDTNHDLNITKALKAGANIVVLLITGNDIFVYNSTKEVWLNNLITIKQEADKYGVEIFFTTSRPSTQWTTGSLRLYNEELSEMIRDEFPNNYIELMETPMKTTVGSNTLALDSLYESISSPDHPNELGTEIIKQQIVNKLDSFFVNKNLYQNYTIERSVDGVNWTIYQTVSNEVVFLELPYEGNEFKYRVKALKNDNSETSYSIIVEPEKPEKVVWAMVGGVDTSSAKITCKVGHQRPVSITKTEPKILTIQWNQSEDLIKYYVNGLLAKTLSRASRSLQTQAWLKNLFIGSSSSFTTPSRFLNGKVCEIILINGVVSLANKEIYENHLASKWLPTGTILGSGYITPATASAVPSLPSGNNPFLVLNENGLTTDSNGKVVSWTDQSSFGGVLTAVPTLSTTAPEITQIKGRNCVNFDGSQSMNVPIPQGTNGSLFENYPNNITMMFVFQIDDFDLTSSDPDENQKVVMGEVQYEGQWGIEVAKFHASSDLEVRLNDYDGRNSGYVPINRSYFVDESAVPNIATGRVRVIYSYDQNFLSPMFSDFIDTYSDSNGVAKFELSGLVSGVNIYYKFEVDGVLDKKINKFQTNYIGAHSFEFCSGSCNTYGFSPTFNFIKDRNPIFFNHLGDLHYRDIGVNNINLFRDALDAQLIGTSLGDLLRNVAFEYVWDDHCFGPNNSDKNNPAKQAVTNWFTENFPSHALASPNLVNGIYRAWTVGRVRFVLTDGRYNRDPFNSKIPKDSTKSLLGSTQLTWFKNELLAAKNSTQIEMIVWLSPTPYSGDPTDPFGYSYYPDGESITDPEDYSFSAIGETFIAYQAERREIANYIYDNSINNLVIIQGDTHMSAIDDGRNSIYATTAPNNFVRRDWTTVPVELLPVSVEASPFDRDPDRGGGPFEINDIYDSGGPYPLVTQASSFFKVIDKGENWIQINIEQWYRNQVSGEWVFNRSYGRNFLALGTPGVPPPFEQNAPDEVFPNGYISNNGEWKKIRQRFIGIENNWKAQMYKWVGLNGYWKLIYTDEIINTQQSFFIRSLNGYTANRGNVIEIFGDRLSDSQYPIPKVGAFFELKQVYSDVFDNFSSGISVGNPQFETIGGETAMHILAEGDYMKTSDNQTSGISGAAILGAYGDNSYGIAFWVYLSFSDKPTNGEIKWVFFSGDIDNHIGVYVSGSDDKLRWVHKSTSGIAEAASTLNFSYDEWVKVTVNRDGNSFSNSKLYINDVEQGAFTSQINPILLSTHVVYVGAGYINASATEIPTVMDPNKTSSNITLSNSNKTIQKSQTVDDYKSSRSEGIMLPNTGKYYFEVLCSQIGANGRIIIGVGDTGVSGNVEALSTGWFITGSSGRYTRSTSRVTWASGNAQYVQGDVVGIIVNTDLGRMSVYVNGVSVGNSHGSGINVAVEAVVMPSRTGTAVVRFDSSEWTHTPNVVDLKQVTINSSAVSGILSSVGMYIKNFYFSGSLLRLNTINRLFLKPIADIVLKNRNTNSEIIIPQEWRLGSNNQRFAFTVPEDLDYAQYDLYIKSLNLKSISLPLNVVPVEKRTTNFIEDFSDPVEFKKRWYFLQKAWGGANGGVVAQNGFIEAGELVLRANGDLYDGPVQGVNNDGTLKFHTNPLDPKFGQPWKRRVGCCIVSQENFGFGSYKFVAKPAQLTGVASAFWTFHYEEIYPGDPRWQSFLDEGLQVQGNQEDGYFITRNHEIDIELPSSLTGEPVNQAVYTNAKLNTWRSETENNYTAHLTELREDMLATNPLINTADGEFHEFRWDWHSDRVEFYLDGLFIRSNTTDIPDLPGKLTLGLWFPSWAGNSRNYPTWKEDTPWLPNPDGAWAGSGANWYQQEMRVRRIEFTPFSETGERLIGETYPFGGLRYFSDGGQSSGLPPVPSIPSVELYVDLINKSLSGIVRIYNENDELVDTQTFEPSVINTKAIKQPAVWRMEIDITSLESNNFTMEIYINGNYVEFFGVPAGQTRVGLKYPYPSGTHSLVGDISLSIY